MKIHNKQGHKFEITLSALKGDSNWLYDNIRANAQQQLEFKELQAILYALYSGQIGCFQTIPQETAGYQNRPESSQAPG